MNSYMLVTTTPDGRQFYTPLPNDQLPPNRRTSSPPGMADPFPLMLPSPRHQPIGSHTTVPLTPNQQTSSPPGMANPFPLVIPGLHQSIGSPTTHQIPPYYSNPFSYTNAQPCSPPVSSSPPLAPLLSGAPSENHNNIFALQNYHGQQRVPYTPLPPTNSWLQNPYAMNPLAAFLGEYPLFSTGAMRPSSVPTAPAFDLSYLVRSSDSPAVVCISPEPYTSSVENTPPKTPPTSRELTQTPTSSHDEPKISRKRPLKEEVAEDDDDIVMDADISSPCSYGEISTCQDCSVIISSRSAYKLLSHIVTHDPTAKRYECSDCGFRTNIPTGIRQHITTKHKLTGGSYVDRGGNGLWNIWRTAVGKYFPDQMKMLEEYIMEAKPSSEPVFVGPRKVASSRLK